MRRETRRKPAPKSAARAWLEAIFGPAGGVAFTFGVALLVACIFGLIAGPLLSLGGGGKGFRVMVVAIVLTLAYYTYQRMKR